MHNVFVVVPAYNESKKIESVLSTLKNYKVVVVDDGSSDSTSKKASKHTKYVINHVINRGQGAALKTGIDFALNSGADIIVTFDADGQFLANEIKKVIAPLNEGYDVVLGSRFLGRAVNLPFLKRLVLKAGVIVVFLLYRIKVTDSQCGFRAMNRKAADKISIFSDRMEHAGEIFDEIIKNKLKYKEVPITVIYDKYSLSKGQSWTRSLSLGIKMLFNRLKKR